MLRSYSYTHSLSSATWHLRPVPIPVPMVPTRHGPVPVPIPISMVSYPYPYPYPWLCHMSYPYPYPYPWSRTRTRTHTHGLEPVPVPIPMASYPYPYPYPWSVPTLQVWQPQVKQRNSRSADAMLMECKKKHSLAWGAERQVSFNFWNRKIFHLYYRPIGLWKYEVRDKRKEDHDYSQQIKFNKNFTVNIWKAKGDS